MSLPLVALPVRLGSRALCCAWPRGPRLLGPLSGLRLAARHLPLGVLRCLPGLLQTVLLALLDPGVPGQEPGLLQRRAVLRVEQGERPGHAEAQRAGLAGDAAAGDPGHHVKRALRAEG